MRNLFVEGTSSPLRWVCSHSPTQAHPRRRCDLQSERPVRFGWLVLFFWIVLPVSHLWGDQTDTYADEARSFEARGLWGRAAEAWSIVIVKDRNNAEAREHYQTCLRHIHQLRRLRDSAFQDDIPTRPLPEALRIYVDVLEQVRENYVDKQRATPEILFRQGIVEFQFALADPAFVEKHLARLPLERLQIFSGRLGQWENRPVLTLEDARKNVQTIAVEAFGELELTPSVVVLEFAFGACSGLDEYTVCLTPAQLQEIQPLLQGQFVGVGIDLEIKGKNGMVLLGRVYPDSPAAQARLNKGDRLLRLNGRLVDEMTDQELAAGLKGPAGTTVALEIVPLVDSAPRALNLERRPITIRTVESPRLLEEGVGYLKVSGFHQNTTQELKEAIMELQTRGMKVLIMDLRDNPGGSFYVAVDVARLFVADGTIAHTQSQVMAKLNKPYESHNTHAYGMPVVLLVNGGTASAAEVLAGALKDNQRALLVGQTTFGKGSMQLVVPLKVKNPTRDRPLLGGIRITFAQFFSPTNQPYSGRGILPDDVVEAQSGNEDVQLECALLAARDLGRMLMPPAH